MQTVNDEEQAVVLHLRGWEHLQSVCELCRLTDMFISVDSVLTDLINKKTFISQ